MNNFPPLQGETTDLSHLDASIHNRIRANAKFVSYSCPISEDGDFNPQGRYSFAAVIVDIAAGDVTVGLYDHEEKWPSLKIEDPDIITLIFWHVFKANAIVRYAMDKDTAETNLKQLNS